MLYTLVLVFNSLNLRNASEPLALLIAQITSYLPYLIAGLIMVLIAVVLASILKMIVNKLVIMLKLDDRLQKDAGLKPLGSMFGDFVFWLVILIMLPAILNAFRLEGLLIPVQNLVNQLLAAIPNIFAAFLIGFAGWIIAAILRSLVMHLLVSSQIDRWGEKLGLNEEIKISKLIGWTVFIFIFVPSLIAALDALQLQAISMPATSMLSQIFNALPSIFAATLILLLTWYIARYAALIVSRLLNAAGINQFATTIGLQKVLPENLKLTDVIRWVIVFFAMLFATVEAFNQLGFVQVADLVSMFIIFGGQIILGVIILSIGFYLANVVYHLIQKGSGPQSQVLAEIVRFAIIGLVLVMGLRSMGIANDIINLAFTLTLGAVAVAFALAFGLGGRQAAGKLLDHWFSKWMR